MTFTAAIIPCPEGGFTVICEEIPGAISQGETEAEALENLQEAIHMVLEANRDLARMEEPHNTVRKSLTLAVS